MGEYFERTLTFSNSQFKLPPIEPFYGVVVEGHDHAAKRIVDILNDSGFDASVINCAEGSYFGTVSFSPDIPSTILVHCRCSSESPRVWSVQVSCMYDPEMTDMMEDQLKVLSSEVYSQIRDFTLSHPGTDILRETGDRWARSGYLSLGTFEFQTEHFTIPKYSDTNSMSLSSGPFLATEIASFVRHLGYDPIEPHYAEHYSAGIELEQDMGTSTRATIRIASTVSSIWEVKIMSAWDEDYDDEPFPESSKEARFVYEVLHNWLAAQQDTTHLTFDRDHPDHFPDGSDLPVDPARPEN